jgi:hypothetical protein
MTTDDYKIAAGVPAVNDYRELRVAAGLSARSERAARLGLPNTLFGVVVTLEGALVGMGRIVGDGGTSYQWSILRCARSIRGAGWARGSWRR